MAVNEWATDAHALAYLERRAHLPRRDEAAAELIARLPGTTRRVLDLGTGDGAILALVLDEFPQATGMAVDFSPAMLEAARQRFAGDGRVEIVDHDLDRPLPRDWGTFDAVVSAFAIHHCTDERKRSLYAEVFDLVEPGGVFCNLEHVSSPTPALHLRFLDAIGFTPDEEDPSNKLLDVETQLRWLREIGFTDVDCHWKWLELALLAGVKP